MVSRVSALTALPLLQADAKKPGDKAYSVARGIYDNQPIVYVLARRLEGMYAPCADAPLCLAFAQSESRRLDPRHQVSHLLLSHTHPLPDHRAPLFYSQQLSATVSGSKKMVGDLAGDAGAKIGALQNALLEELGHLKVSH